MEPNERITWDQSNQQRLPFLENKQTQITTLLQKIFLKSSRHELESSFFSPIRTQTISVKRFVEQGVDNFPKNKKRSPSPSSAHFTVFACEKHTHKLFRLLFPLECTGGSVSTTDSRESTHKRGRKREREGQKSRKTSNCSL